MNRTLLLAQSLYSEMGKSEKKVADWLFSHSGENFSGSITELAEKCDSSEATIVRFSRRLGFQGFSDLKLSLAQEVEKKVISPYITESDSCYEIFEKLCNDTYLSLERTKKMLVSENLTNAVKALAGARKIVLIGLGSSATAAAEAANKFLRAGYNAASYADTHMQAIVVSQLTELDVLIGVSQSGSSKDIVECLKLAKSRGVTTICVTGKEKSPITRQSDISLVTDTEEVRHSYVGLNSHLSRTLLMDALCFGMAYAGEGDRLAGISSNAQALESKRINDDN